MIEMIHPNSKCLLSPNSSKDDKDLNNCWTLMDSSTVTRNPETLPSTLHGDARKTNNQLPVPATLT